MTKEEIRVAAILNNTSLIITAGSENGIEVGQMIKILDSKGSIIRDPKNNKPLGHYPITKAILKVSKVFPNFSVCRTKSISKINGSSLLEKQRSIYNEIISTEIETFKFNGTPLLNDYDFSNNPIEVGDPVELTPLTNNKD